MLRFVLFVLLCAPLLHAGAVLVLPFSNQSKSPNLDWIGESIAENVREALASKGLLVLDREDRQEAYRRLSVRGGAVLTRATVVKIGQALDASQVIFGHYEFTPAADAAPSKGSLRIVARVLDLAQTRQGPEYAQIGALEDLAVLETRLGWQTLRFVAPKAATSEQEFFNARPPVRLDAMENYIRGLLATTAEQKHRFYTQAARLDERFSEPCYQLGKIYWLRKDYAIAANWLKRVRRTDSHYLEALFYLGLCNYYSGDFAASATCFRTVAESVPLNEVWNDLGAAQSRQSAREALDSFKKALEGDDADPDYHFNIGYVQWKAGRFSEAVESFRAALERNPADAEATLFLGRALKKDGPRPAEAKAGGRERLKTTYEETAYKQLKAEIEGKK